MYYHVAAYLDLDVAKARMPIASARTYKTAREYALHVYDSHLQPGEAIEITYLGLVVWGPFVKGDASFVPSRS